MDPSDHVSDSETIKWYFFSRIFLDETFKILLNVSSLPFFCVASVSVKHITKRFLQIDKIEFLKSGNPPRFYAEKTTISQLKKDWKL